MRLRRVVAAGALALIGVATAAAASAPVTIFARSSTLGPFEPAELFGTVGSSRVGEDVTIQAKDCGHDSFRVVSGTTTRRGGSWSAEYSPGIGTTLRAVWKGSASSQITI